MQHHARLPPHYFVRAFFSLVDKGLIVVTQPRALTSVDLLQGPLDGRDAEPGP